MMDGACVYETTRTDGKLENGEFFFWIFWPLVGPLLAGGCKFLIIVAFILICPDNKHYEIKRFINDLRDFTLK